MLSSKLFILLFGLLLLCGVTVIFGNSTTASLLNSLEDDDDIYYPNQNWSDPFDWKLFKSISYLNNGDNILISPVSLKLVLALLYEGASGLTEREFQSVLNFSTKKSIDRDNFKRILSIIQANNGGEYILNLGTRIFLDSNIQPQQQYRAKAKDSYQTEIESTNFSNAFEASNTINLWINNITKGKINKMLSADDIGDALMIISNAIYFKGTWRHKFPKEKTKSGGFYINPNKTIQVNYMTVIEKFYYYDSSDLDAKILRLPYKGKRYSLFIILPKSKGGLQNLIENINLRSIKQQLFNMEEVIVEVVLPKFKYDFQTSYINILQSYGLQQMFQNTASFPGIARVSPNVLRQLVVTDIIQKTGIEFDEEGSEVFSATDVHIGNKFGEADNVFNATHPFMYFIEEQSTGTVLFVGKVERPIENDHTKVPIPNRISIPLSVADQALPLSNVPDLQPENPEFAVTLQRFNYFDLELLYVLTESHGNVFISPASIKTTLALILEGAQGKCAQEIGSALRIDNINENYIRTILNRLLFDLSDKAPNTVLESSNGVFVSNKLTLVPEYKQKVTEFYKANVQDVDFINAPNEAVKIINNWASTSTHGLINDIVGGHVDKETKLVLANTLYFKGKWKTSFDEKSTRLKCFYSTIRGCVNTPLMLVSDVFNYSLVNDLNAHAIDLPYEDDKYSMLILLPAKGNNIKSLARDIQHAKFSHILDQLKPNEIIFEMPIFTMDYTTDLIRNLVPLKIVDIFGEKANLSGIVKENNIKIDAMLHKTHIEVNEQGTKAAAATSALVVPLMGTEAQRIVADHPFIFFIYHKQSKNIIFEGMFVEPSFDSTPLTKTRLVARQRYYHN